MPDELTTLAERLLELAQAQGRCLAEQDFDGFVRCSEARLAVTEQLRRQAGGRGDLRTILTQVAELDAQHETLLAALRVELEHERHQMQPQQSAVLAYFQGDVPLAAEARFFDRRD